MYLIFRLNCLHNITFTSTKQQLCGTARVVIRLFYGYYRFSHYSWAFRYCDSQSESVQWLQLKIHIHISICFCFSVCQLVVFMKMQVTTQQKQPTTTFNKTPSHNIKLAPLSRWTLFNILSTWKYITLFRKTFYYCKKSYRLVFLIFIWIQRQSRPTDRHGLEFNSTELHFTPLLI